MFHNLMPSAVLLFRPYAGIYLVQLPSNPQQLLASFHPIRTTYPTSPPSTLAFLRIPTDAPSNTPSPTPPPPAPAATATAAAQGAEIEGDHGRLYQNTSSSSSSSSWQQRFQGWLFLGSCRGSSQVVAVPKVLPEVCAAASVGLPLGTVVSKQLVAMQRQQQDGGVDLAAAATGGGGGGGHRPASAPTAAAGCSGAGVAGARVSAAATAAAAGGGGGGGHAPASAPAAATAGDGVGSTICWPMLQSALVPSIAPVHGAVAYQDVAGSCPEQQVLVGAGRGPGGGKLLKLRSGVGLVPYVLDGPEIMVSGG